MKKFINKVIVFSIPIVLYSILAIIYMPNILSLQFGPSTKQQITYSFENSINSDYEQLILGNSRTYRGLNPEKFTRNSFNFSHDNDSYNQIYYKLEFLLKNKKKIKYLILGLDYFQFSFKSDTRNYVYADLLHNRYMKDYEDNNVLQAKMDYYLGNLNPNKLLSLSPNAKKPFLRKNGQYIKSGWPKESDSVERNVARIELQVKYFENTLDLCLSNNIKIFIVTLPTRQNELNSYLDIELDEFHTFIDQYTDNENVFYLNYSNIESFKLEDYTDITHLNESAADRFSLQLNDSINKLY